MKAYIVEVSIHGSGEILGLQENLQNALRTIDPSGWSSVRIVRTYVLGPEAIVVAAHYWEQWHGKDKVLLIETITPNAVSANLILTTMNRCVGAMGIGSLLFETKIIADFYLMNQDR